MWLPYAGIGAPVSISCGRDVVFWEAYDSSSLRLLSVILVALLLGNANCVG